jgi:hypothetical protein
MLFPKLPKELRFLIWEYALPPLRVVWLVGSRPEESELTCPGIESTHGEYPIVHDKVCRESWEVFSNSYHRLETIKSVSPISESLIVSLVRGPPRSL